MAQEFYLQADQASSTAPITGRVTQLAAIMPASGTPLTLSLDGSASPLLKIWATNGTNDVAIVIPLNIAVKAGQKVNSSPDSLLTITP